MFGSDTEILALFALEREVTAAVFTGGAERKRTSLKDALQADPRETAVEIARALEPRSPVRLICPGGLLGATGPGLYRLSGEAVELAGKLMPDGTEAKVMRLALALAEELDARHNAFMLDPLSSDSLAPLNRFSSINGVPKQSRYPACLHNALIWGAAYGLLGDRLPNVGGETAPVIKRPEELRVIVAHIDDYTSVGAHALGRCLDVNDVYGCEGPMGFRASGDVPAAQLSARFVGRLQNEPPGRALEDMRAELTGNSGLHGYLGISEPEELDALLSGTGEKSAAASLILDALVYQTAKWIGSSALVLEGRVDAIILSGKGPRCRELERRLRGRSGSIAPVLVAGSEDTQNSLAFYLAAMATAAGGPAAPVAVNLAGGPI